MLQTSQASGTKDLARGDETWRVDGCEVRVSQPAQQIVLFEFSGRMAASLVPRIERYVETVAVRGMVHLFFDTEAMNGYEPAFRADMTAWHERMKPKTASAGVLVRSKIVSMAIAIANLVTGGMLKTYADRRSFDEAVAAACRNPS